MEKTYEEITTALEAIEGVTDIKTYTLINNYGAYFKKDGVKFDLRRWANCYGTDIGWGVSITGNYKGLTTYKFDDAIQFIKDWKKD